MTLPITESILRGELRPNHIAETVSAEKQSLLMRQLRHASERTNLIELEKDIVCALGDVAQVANVYERDKELRYAISNLNRSASPNSYTRVYTAMLSNVMKGTDISTPTLKMYKTILCLEKERTIRALVELHTIMKDDSFIRPETKRLLESIKGYSQEVARWQDEAGINVATLLQNMLIELYFSLILTFSPILYSQGDLDFDDDFEDFVFQWKGAFPTKEENDKYLEEKNRIQKENAIIRQKSRITALEENEEVQEQAKQPLTKAEKFLEDASQYAFMEMPMIVALDSNEDRRRQKALRLTELMLDSPAHAAAMLDYLGFYKWIKDKYERGYTLTAYDKFCTKVVMGQDGEAFKNYRLSLDSDRSNYKKYHSWKYSDPVIEEYQTCLNGKFLGKDL